MPRQPQKLGLLLTALLFAATTGCFPIVWLPDSSGFVYTTHNKDTVRLMHHDVATKKLRVVVANLPCATVWPAVSPDGKQVAVAALTANKKKPMQIIIYDLEGKEVRRSPEFAWGPTRNEGSFMITGVFWAGDKIIVQDFEDQYPAGNQNQKRTSTTGICDLKNNTMIIVEGAPAAFAGTPVRPDGKGFLVTKPVKAGDKWALALSFVDWQGKLQPIDLPADIDGRGIGLISGPWTGTSSWQGNVAEVTSGTLRVRIDTDKRIGTVTRIPDSQGKVKDMDILQQYAFPDSKLKIRVLGAGEDRRLELVKAGEPRLLKMANMWVMSASPNGKWLAMREFPGDGSDAQPGDIFLFDGTGETRQFRAIPR